MKMKNNNYYNTIKKLVYVQIIVFIYMSIAVIVGYGSSDKYVGYYFVSIGIFLSFLVLIYLLYCVKRMSDNYE